MLKSQIVLGLLEIPDIFEGGAGPESTYEEKMRVPPWGLFQSKNTSES